MSESIPSQSENTLIAGGRQDPLLPHLIHNINQAIELEFSVAFILRSGIELIREHLEDFLNRQGKARILTGDYQYVTDPHALFTLLDLEGDIGVRIFESGGKSFHPKYYGFKFQDGSRAVIIGSSNLTKTGLCEGIEWNYHLNFSATSNGYIPFQQAFQKLFEHPQTLALEHDWIKAYQAKRQFFTFRLNPESIAETMVNNGYSVATNAEDETIIDNDDRYISLNENPDIEQKIKPHLIQQKALDSLKKTRSQGNRAGLVVLATGLGKTWLSAFDTLACQSRKILFVAHREEILDQARKTFRKIRPDSQLGKYDGTFKDKNVDVLFASIQTLGKSNHLRNFEPQAFDYVIIDEFHHASARTYRNLIEYFQPEFLLGLTATPERMDGGDLLTLCQENLVFRCDFVQGIQQKLLSPIKYFGIPDDIDYAQIPWKSSRFDEEALTRAVSTQKRAQHIFEQYHQRAGNRTLAFCCSRSHADFMSKYFSHQGIRSVAVHSGSDSAPRALSLEQLQSGELQIIFAVDMFNEGVDVPLIDTVMMLRPTESPVIWMQQLGRGLRIANGKTHLTVIDYIGNHRIFLKKLQTLLTLRSGDREIAKCLQQLQNK
ncbi:MAG: DEAD/DEAH box helicase family protein, partial [SAR324 cluster bacterium]|nr:DEAD/DEAH box helicase family protein [SAR324 cluster bacterium]